MWWVTVLPRCHAERILGISMHILYHCHRNVFLETAANPYVTALGDPKSAPRRLNLAQSFNGLELYSCHVSQQTDSEWQPLYPRHPAHFFSPVAGRLHSNRNRRHETSYLLLAMLLIVIAIIFIFSKLPKIKRRKYDGRSRI